MKKTIVVWVVVDGCGRFGSFDIFARRERATADAKSNNKFSPACGPFRVVRCEGTVEAGVAKKRVTR